MEFIDQTLEVLVIIFYDAIVHFIIKENKLPAFYVIVSSVNNASSIRTEGPSDDHNGRKEEEEPFNFQRDIPQIDHAIVEITIGMDMGMIKASSEDGAMEKIGDYADTEEMEEDN